MTKYTKKPLVVDAVQWNGRNFKAVEKLLGPDAVKLDPILGLVIETGPISMHIIRGSFIIKETADADPIVLSQFKFDKLYLPLKKK